MDLESFGAALMTVGVPAGSAVAWLWYQREQRVVRLWQQQEQKHVTTITEYQSIVADVRKQYFDMKQDYDSLWKQFQAAEVRCDVSIAKLRDEMEQQRQRSEEEFRQLADRLTRSQVSNQALRSEIITARASEASLRAGMHPFFSSPSAWSFATITADKQGKILSANPGCEVLFHWTTDELIGSNLEMLIPERYRTDHRAAMDLMARRGSISQVGRVLSVTARTKEGEELPVEVYIEVWPVGGEPRCWAAVRRRWRSMESAGFLDDTNSTSPPVPVTVVNPTPIPVVVAPPQPPELPEGAEGKS